MSTEPYEEPKRGNAVFFALLIVLVIAFGALVADIGYARMVQADLQNAVDAGALGGAGKLDHTAAGLDAAQATAIHIADLNPSHGPDVDVVPSEVELGIVGADRVFHPSTVAKDVNAVRVSEASEMPAVLSYVAFGRELLGASASAIAVLPPPENAGETTCFLPLAIPDCRWAAGQDPNAIEHVIVRMTNANADNVAWALPGTANPGDAAVSDVLRRGCGGHVAVDDRTSMNTGAMANAFRTLAEQVNASTDAWDASKWGPLPTQLEGSLIRGYGQHVLQGAIMMFDSPSYCADTNGDGAFDGGSFNEDDVRVSGIAWAVIFDVKGQGGRAPAAADIQMVLDLSPHETGTGGGGEFGGGVVWQGPAVLLP